MELNAQSYPFQMELIWLNIPSKAKEQAFRDHFSLKADQKLS